MLHSHLITILIFPQDIFNNPFGDYTNQLISDVASATMGKSTEITDMVLQQQQTVESAVEFCTNLTDTLTTNLNSINNNKLINNGSHDEEDDNDVNMEADVDFMMDLNQQPHEQQPQQQVVPDIMNDDNNNSNDNAANNLGPETDVDAIIDDEEFHFNAASGGGEKERHQMEFKETADVIDHFEGSSDIATALENKIFGEMFPEMKGGNPFATESFAAVDTEMPLDNKLLEEQQSELQQQFEYGANEFSEKLENAEREIDFAMHEIATSAVGFTDELISSANNEEVAMKQEEEPQSGKLHLHCI